MPGPSAFRARRLLRTLRQTPTTALLCACKKLEMRLLGRRASTHVYHRPLGIDIELSNVCNLQCPWCDTQHYSDKSIKKRFFPFDKFQIVAPKLKGVNRVIFCGGGETLTHPQASEAIGLVKQYVPTVLLHSNGVLLKGERAEKLAASGLDQLRISIDGSDDETFRQVRGTDLTPILDNLKQFSKLCQTPITTISVLSKTNWRSLLDVPDVLRQVDNVRMLAFQPVEVGFLGWDAERYHLNRDELKEFCDAIRQKCERYGLETNVDDAEFDPLFSKPFELCGYPFSGYITLNYEGFLAPCCRLTNVVHMGDLTERSFEEIWNGEAFRRLRRLMLDGDYPEYCHDRCEYRVKMNPVPAPEPPGRLRYTKQSGPISRASSPDSELVQIEAG